MTPKEQVKAMREAKKRDLLENLTFKPMLISSTAGAAGETTTSASTRFDRLYYDAKQRLEKEKSAVVAAAAAEIFKPKITARAASRERQSDAARSRGDAVQSEQRGRAASRTDQSRPAATPAITKRASSIDRSGKVGERLYTAAVASAVKKEQVKQETAKKMAAECTFSPKLSGGARRSTSTSRMSVTPAEVAARQQQYEEARAKRRTDLVKSQEQRETAELKFKPTLAAQSVNDSLRPQDDATTVFERLQKATTKDHAELQQEIDPELTFRPKVAPYALSNRPDEARDVHAKLYQEGLAKAQQRQDEAERRQAQELAKLTFHPSLPTAPNPSLSISNVQAHTQKTSPEPPPGAPGSEAESARSSSTVFDRLTYSTKSQTADMLLQLKVSQELSQCTFKPALPTSTTFPDFPREDIFARLQKDAEAARDKAARKEQQKEHRELSQATFRPHISSSSRELAAARKTAAAVVAGEVQRRDSGSFPPPHPMSVQLPQLPLLGPRSSHPLHPPSALPPANLQVHFSSYTTPVPLHLHVGQQGQHFCPPVGRRAATARQAG